MTKMEFAEKIATKVNGKVNEVEKTNGIRLIGVCVGEGDIRPTIYIDTMYDKGMSIDEAVVEINKIVDEQALPEINVNDITNYENVKDKIVLRLYNGKTNTEVFRSAEEYGFNDLILVPYLIISEKGGMFTKVGNGLLSMWGKTADEVLDIAMENTMKQKFYCAPVSKIMTNILFGAESEEYEDCFESKHPGAEMFCIGNPSKMYGAIGAIIKREMLKEHFPNGYYILPSSVHEVLLLPKDGCSLNDNELTDMVRAVNASDVRPEDVLADHTYFIRDERR